MNMLLKLILNINPIPHKKNDWFILGPKDNTCKHSPSEVFHYLYCSYIGDYLPCR